MEQMIITLLNTETKNVRIIVFAAFFRFELAREEADTLRLKNETLEKQLEQLDESYTQERLQAERALQEQIEELRHKLKDQKAARREQNDS
ncbi:unnamed protein product, partial [Heligmosomoides polygyrus]|uniref:Myosin_tail_1 domain-containing protein n=1 Tax=Heligmosomoides polygyrus TaxID=6339 RepID=A0A183FCV8_HELPZ